MPMRRPLQTAWKKARSGAGSSGSPHALAKDGLPRALKERPPDGARLRLEGVRGQARINRYFPIASRERIGNNGAVESLPMLVLTPAMLIAIAALISACSAFIWTLRRKP
jgi:hypothetical protein